jgi:hypothetical protein
MEKLRNIANGLNSSLPRNVTLIQIALFSILLTSLIQNIRVLLDPSVARVRFGDLNSNLLSAECFQNIGLLVYASFDDVGNCNYLYGRSYLYFLNFFSISPSNRLVLGIVQGLILVVLLLGLIFLTKKAKFQLSFVFFSILFAPGMILLLERANLDGVMLILITIAILFNHFGYKYLAWFIVAISVLFKFYTLPFLMLYSCTFKSKFARFSMLGLASIVALIIIQDVKLAGANIPTGIFVTFGLMSTSRWINLYLEHQSLISFRFTSISGGLLSSLFIIVMVLVLFRSIRLSPHVQGRFRELHVSIFVFFIIIFLSCYFAGMNYDYRLPFLGIALFAIVPLLEWSKFLRVQTSLLSLFVFWGGTQFGLNNAENQAANVLVQSVTDVLLLYLVAFSIVVLIRVIKSFNDLRRDNLATAASTQ